MKKVNGGRIARQLMEKRLDGSIIVLISSHYDHCGYFLLLIGLLVTVKCTLSSECLQSRMAKISFKQQVLQAREDAIITSVNRLLALKGFDSITVDEVAADVGIAKASLYKHFKSKEELAGAAMIRVLDRTLALIDTLHKDPQTPAIAQLQSVARWTMQVQLAGEMPSLPAQNSTLRATLVNSKVYMDRLMAVSDKLGAWITQAQSAGQIDPKLAPEVVLYTLFARACDPVLGLLKAGGQHSDEHIIDMLLSTCFNGLSGADAGADAKPGARVRQTKR